MFIDTVVIYIASGNGGDGRVSFRREKFAPKGGPDGGNGGKGGDVIVVADPHMSTLLDFRYRQHYRAGHGQAGGTSNWTGKQGNDVVIRVPCGTLVRDAETGEVLADLTVAGQEVTLMRGGKGGRGNAAFATAINQAPRYAEPGQQGQERKVKLELKLIADVGLVGFPNAGKSTLIAALSAARPKIADYPFTTLVPNLGVVSLSDDPSRNAHFCIADIPGIIEGAHEGRGLGLQFLRHIERTQVLVFLLDPLAEISVQEQFSLLRRELTLYNSALDTKERIICINKADVLTNKERRVFSNVQFDGEKPVYIISGVSGERLDELKYAMWNTLAASRAMACAQL
ncbi:MAG: GTPase ObgE [Bacteroidota bacterium]|nr:GTPase ObgE [Candidatus Kapabacteria bacterium]MDW8220569.1 GTPase ObgE [Bacteroidota bacterium]